jgi:AcrR family transcriptional regulator
MSQPASPLALEPHGARRREQLVRAAAFVIETEGIDAMRMPRVAEVARCARSLVYRYFPRREDLFVAVISEFYEKLEARVPPELQADGMRSLDDAAGARPLLEAIWDVVAEIGAAGLVLTASPRLGVELNERLGEVSARMEDAWIGPLREAGLGEIEASLVLRSAVALQSELLDRHRKGELSRDRALALGQRALAALVVGLRPEAVGVTD